MLLAYYFVNQNWSYHKISDDHIINVNERKGGLIGMDMIEALI